MADLCYPTGATGTPEGAMPRHKSKPEYVPGSQTDQLHGAFDGFELDRQSTGLSPHTLRFYRSQLLPFVEWCVARGVDDPRLITAEVIQRYTVEVHAHNKPATRKICNVIIRCFLNFCVERGYIEAIPRWKLPKAPKDGQARPFLTGAEVQRVYSVAKSLSDQCLVAVLSDSGIRRSEAAGLTWDCVNPATGELKIVGGKGGKNRSAFVGEFTRGLLAKLKVSEGDGLVFRNRYGHPLQTPAMSRRLTRLGELAGVKLSSHRLRRTYGVLATVNGMSPFQLQDTMGHSKIEQTRQYVQLATEHLRAAYAPASPMDHLRLAK